MDKPEFSIPVIIAGGGACGAVAALAARDCGHEVLLIERDKQAAGSTAMSQGLFCAAGTRFQKAKGIEDSADTFFADIIAKTRGQTDPVIARTIADHSAPTLEWLVDRHDFPWTLNDRFRAAYGNSRARIHGWEGRGGEDMMQWLHHRLQHVGVDVMYDTRLVDIHAENDAAISAVSLLGGDGETTLVGCNALILACGGFGANREMTQKFMPETADFPYHGHEGSSGDAITLGEKLGAAVGDMGSYQGYAMLAEPGGVSVPPNVLIEGGIIVNARGERFTDESLDIAGMVLPLSKQPDSLGWVIFDAGINRLCEHIPELIELTKMGVVKSAETLEQLAQMSGLPHTALAKAIAAAQTAKAEKQRDAFGRDWQGSRPPAGHFCCVRVTGALYHTQGGLQIDKCARVVKTDGSSIANLFAGGGSARAVSGPSSWGYLPAMGLTTAVVLGAVAGKEAGKIAAAAQATADT